MAGYKRQEIKRNADAGLTTDNAKEPLNFNCYKILARAFMKGKPDDCYLWTFAHTYFLLQWNSLSRNETVIALSLTKIKWVDDALLLHFLKMKNDQNGTQSVKPKHIYANPFTPEICPILLFGNCSVTRIDKAVIYSFQDLAKINVTLEHLMLYLMEIMIKLLFLKQI
jgi:hypothetical protein